MMLAYQDPRRDAADLTPHDMLYVSGISGALTGFTLGLALRRYSTASEGDTV